MENLKQIITDINNLFSYNNISTQNDIDKQLMSMFSLYKIEDIEKLIRFTSQYNLAILNDNNITKELNQLLESYKENPNVENNFFENIVLSVKKLYRPKNVNLTYRQHCEEIFSLISNAIIIDSDPDKFLYELLYQKLLINQLNSEESIDDLINNDLTRYIPQEKLALVKQDFSDLLKLKNILSIDDMMLSLLNIKSKLNTNFSCTKNKETNMNKTQKNLNKTDFTSDSKEVVDEDNLEPDNISDDNQPDQDFAPDNEFSEEDELEQQDLSKKTKKILSRLTKLKSTNLNYYDQIAEKLIKKLVRLEEGRDDIVNWESSDGKREGTITYDYQSDQFIVQWVDNSGEQEELYDSIDEIVECGDFFVIDLSKVKNKHLLNKRSKNMTKKKRINLSKEYSIELKVGYGTTTEEVRELGERNGCKAYIITEDDWPISVEYTSTNEENLKNLLKDYSGNDADKIEYLSQDIRVENLSFLIKKRDKMKKKQKNLNTSMILEEGDEDNLDETKVVIPELPNEMKEEDLVKTIAVELSKQRKLDAAVLAAVTELSSKVDKAINLSQREISLNRNYILLNEAAEEVSSMMDEGEEGSSEDEDNMDDQEDQSSQDNSGVDTSEENQSRINHSRHAKLKQDKSHRATSTNLSATKKSTTIKSGLDILLSRYTN